MKEIILVTFGFPPQTGIGVRRWAKFSKYLEKSGYIINVVTINFEHEESNDNWLKDIQSNNIILHKLKSPYPTWLLKNSNRTFIEKAFGKIFRTFFQTFFYPICYSEGWQKELIPYVRNLINKKNIKNVIVNTPPHLLAYYMSILKSENPKVNLIVDQRDPWNTMERHKYGTYVKNFKTKEKMLYMEQFILSHANKVVVVSKEMKDDLVHVYSEYENKINVISNGYDVEDYRKNNGENILSKGINIVYAGSFGAENRNLAIKLILKAIVELNDEFIVNNLTINIYSTANDSFFIQKDIPLEIYKKIVVLYKTMPQAELFDEINKNTYCLSINGPYDSKAMGTKIYDYVQLNKKVIHISNGGELYDMLNNDSNFVSDYQIENVKGMLLKIKDDYLNKSFLDVNHSSFDRFNIKFLAKEYEKLFI